MVTVHSPSGSRAQTAENAPPPTAVAAFGVAVQALRTGMVLCAVAALTDWLFAAIAGAGPATHLEGLALSALAVAAVMRPGAASRVLLLRGAVPILAAVFAVAGAVDSGFQGHYAEVAPAIVFVAALVSSWRWVAATLVISAAGYLADLALAGRSLSWMFVGAGRSDVTTQLADLVLNGLIGLLLIALLRRFVARAPQILAAARQGDSRTITPALAAAVARAPAMLPAPDPQARIASLTPAEVGVLDLLATGLAPKQAARELSVSLATVRSHIAAGKRKTEARTLEQLVAIYAEATRVG
jgi:DNA-binding CsgD family transcriptional regulator